MVPKRNATYKQEIRESVFLIKRLVSSGLKIEKDYFLKIMQCPGQFSIGMLGGWEQFE